MIGILVKFYVMCSENLWNSFGGGFDGYRRERKSQKNVMVKNGKKISVVSYHGGITSRGWPISFLSVMKRIW